MIAEYIWIDGSGVSLRSKSKTLFETVQTLDELPVWSYDGSSCGEADNLNSEVLLKPVAMFQDPLRSGKNILVLCETYTHEELPTSTNFRNMAMPIYEKTSSYMPLFGLEEEYLLMEGVKPLGWPLFGEPCGDYYCTAGNALARKGRQVAYEHQDACLRAGIKLAGVNAEVTTGEWEFEIGECTATEVGDHLWVARYLLCRIAEKYGLNVSFIPKYHSNWNGSGCHANFSTQGMRTGEVSLQHIIERLSENHELHIALYGDNSERLTGKHETSNKDVFTWGIGNREASVRVPIEVASEGRGYIEDRRPAADADPYVVTSAILCSTLLTPQDLTPLAEHYLRPKTQ